MSRQSDLRVMLIFHLSRMVKGRHQKCRRWPVHASLRLWETSLGVLMSFSLQMQMSIQIKPVLTVEKCCSLFSQSRLTPTDPSKISDKHKLPAIGHSAGYKNARLQLETQNLVCFMQEFLKSDAVFICTGQFEFSSQWSCDPPLMCKEVKSSLRHIQSNMDPEALSLCT